MKKEFIRISIFLIFFMTLFIFPIVYGNNEESYADMAWEYEERCKYKEAIYYYSRAIGENPDPYWYGRRADLYQKVGLYEEAIDDYNIILSNFPDNQAYYLYRGRAYYNLKLYNLAIKDYTKAIELEENEKDIYYSKYSHANLYLQRAIAYKKLGDNYNYEFDLRAAADISDTSIEYYEMQRPREFSNDILLYLSILILSIGLIWIKIKKNRVLPSTNQEIGYSAFFFATIVGLITIMLALNITSAHSPPLMVYISCIFFYPIIYSINRYVKNRYNSSIDKNKVIKNLTIYTAIFIGIAIFAQIQLNSMKELMWGTYEIFCHSMGNQFLLRGIVSFIGPIGAGLGTMLISLLYKKKFGKDHFVLDGKYYQTPPVMNKSTNPYLLRIEKLYNILKPIGSEILYFISYLLILSMAFGVASLTYMGFTTGPIEITDILLGIGAIVLILFLLLYTLRYLGLIVKGIKLIYDKFTKKK